MARNDDLENDRERRRLIRKRQQAATRRLVLVLGTVLVGFVLVVAVGIVIAVAMWKRAGTVEENAGGQAAVATDQPKVTNNGQVPLTTVTRRFGEWVSSGDLQVRVVWGDSNRLHIRGLVGSNDRSSLLILELQARNTHAGRMIDWPGWQGKGWVEDEFGNKFMPVEG